MPQSTPEFVSWAIQYHCPLRGDHVGASPQQVERQLRPLRAVWEAKRAGRIFEGVCVHDQVAIAATSPTRPLGFEAEEVLRAYGGNSFVASQCLKCPANASQTSIHPEWVGCYGWLTLDGPCSNLALRVEEVIDQLGLQTQVASVFPHTRPRWYGLWMAPHPSRQQMASRQQMDLLHQILTSVLKQQTEHHRALQMFCLALQTCQQHDLALACELIPAGQADHQHWRVPAHCSQCKAIRTRSQRHCRVCGCTGSILPARRRHVRGTRPYWPLEDFMGSEKAQAFVQRYLRYRQDDHAQTRSTSPD